MRDRLAHRGPDHAQQWIDEKGHIGLAHRRLSIIDTSAASHQPMPSADGSLMLVYNGEIYNYIELREELIAFGHSFKTRSDTEVLLVAYQQWGDEFLLRLNGMFAFALWDANKQSLLVARDRFGEKPLFIGKGLDGSIAFASEMKAILAHPAFPDTVNHQSLSSYGQNCWAEDGEETFFSALRRLPPAYAARYSTAGIETSRWRYWIPDYTAIDHSISSTEASQRFLELMEQSVSLRLRSDVPVGSSLSGGLDSSLIVGLLSRERAQRSFSQHTFSACFDDDPTMSEGDQVEQVVRHTGVLSHIVKPSAQGLIEDSRELHWHQEEPFLSASIYLQWCVARLAKEHDTIVLLDGQGADELLGGYQFWFKQHQMDLLDHKRYLHALRVTSAFNRRLQHASRSYADSARRFNTHTALSTAQLLALSLYRPASYRTEHETGLIAAGPGNRFRRTLGEALQYNSLPVLLRYADRNAMAFSRETRMPFLDHRLVDFCIALPDDILTRDGWQKWPLREASKGLMPEPIRWRADKVGYAAPLDIWLRNDLKEWAHERLHHPALRDIDGYKGANLDALWTEHQAGANHSWALWRWISLAEWLMLHQTGRWKQA